MPPCHRAVGILGCFRPAAEDPAPGSQPDDLAACSGTSLLYSRRVARRHSSGHGLAVHSPLSVFHPRCALWVVRFVCLLARSDINQIDFAREPSSSTNTTWAIFDGTRSASRINWSRTVNSPIPYARGAPIRVRPKRPSPKSHVTSRQIAAASQKRSTFDRRCPFLRDFLHFARHARPSLCSHYLRFLNSRTITIYKMCIL